MIAAFLAALTLTPAPTPNVIGVGRAYRPPAATSAVRAGRSIGALRCTRGGARFGVHVELFARRRVIVVPAGIGVAAPFRTTLGDVAPSGCSYPARTLTPTGVVEVRQGSRLALGDLFRIWSRPLGPRRLAGFRGATPVAAFVGGRRWLGDPRAIPLRRHGQIVLELDGYVTPHRSFLFPGGL